VQFTSEADGRSRLRLDRPMCCLSQNRRPTLNAQIFKLRWAMQKK